MATFLLIAVFAATNNVVIAEREDEEMYEEEEEEENEENESRQPEIKEIPATTTTAPAQIIAPQIVPTPQTLKKMPTPINTPGNIPATTDITADADHDGIIDANDKHPGEDDFAFNISDLNGNGIIDELENMIKDTDNDGIIDDLENSL